MTLVSSFALNSVYLFMALSAPCLASAGYIRGNLEPELPKAAAVDRQRLAKIASNTNPQHEHADSRELSVQVCQVISHHRVYMGSPCAYNQELLVDGFCYDVCLPGYRRSGVDCIQACTRPWIDSGETTCEHALPTFTRDPFVPNSEDDRSPLTQCEISSPTRECETISGALYYLCPEGYTSEGTSCNAVIDCVASGYNSSSTVSPHTCVKNKIEGGPGAPQACPEGSEIAVGPNCYAPCGPNMMADGEEGCKSVIPPGFVECGNGFAAQDFDHCWNVPLDAPRCTIPFPTSDITTCSCDTPNAGAAGHNRFTCTDGYSAYCTSTSACVETTPWEKDSDTNFCAVTCSCDTPNAGTAGHNRFTCTDGYAAYCTATTACVETNPWVKDSDTDFCGPVTCSCDTPNAGTAGHNRFTCTDGYAAYCTSTTACTSETPWVKDSDTIFCG